MGHATQLRLSLCVTMSLDGRILARQSHTLDMGVRRKGHIACGSFKCVLLFLNRSRSSYTALDSI